MSKVLPSVAVVAILSAFCPDAFGKIQNQTTGCTSLAAPTQNLHYSKNQSMEVRLLAAKNLVNEAIAAVEKDGLNQALVTFRNQAGPYCKKYEHHYSGLIVLNEEGIALSYCKLPGLIGKNVLAWKSPEGRLTFHELLKKASENPKGATLTLMSNLSPHTSQPSPVTFFVKLSGSLIFAVPVYHDENPHKDLTPAEDVMIHTKQTS